MADRAVRKTKKNSEGDIVALCNDAKVWSPRSKAKAIADIEDERHSYFVPWRDRRTEIRVVDGATGKYLRTDHDDTTRNNLLDLPDC